MERVLYTYGIFAKIARFLAFFEKKFGIEILLYIRISNNNIRRGLSPE